MLFAGAGIDFNHAAVRDVNIRTAVCIAFDTGAVTVTFAGGVNGVEKFAERSSNNVLRQIGFVFCPVGFHHAGARIFPFNLKTDGRPEVQQRFPNLFRREVDLDISFAAVFNNFCHDGCGQNRSGAVFDSGAGSVLASLFGFSNLSGGNGLSLTGNGKTIVHRELRKIRRNF